MYRCVGQGFLKKKKKEKMRGYARILKYLDKTQFLLYRTTIFLCLKTYYLFHRRIVSTMKPQKNIFLVHCPKNQHGDKLPDNTQSMLFLKE